ncbi:hypothetical protein ALP75_200466 [Pseudomonas syringae pv. actinidiae]|nr:hypothetical protein ALP75_200466 [Pseudomonas syringae pv. actinidiae]
MHLCAGGFDRRDLARPHTPFGDLQAAFGQCSGLTRQLQTRLRPRCGIKRLNHVGAQFVATLFKLQSGSVLTLASRFDTRTAFAAQFQRLAKHHGGGAVVAAGVFHFPRPHRVGDQPGLLAITLCNADFPLRGCKLRVVGKGRFQCLRQADALGPCHTGGNKR